MSPTAASMLRLLQLLLLLLLSSSDQSAANDHIDPASGRIDARVQMPTGTVHVRAYAAAQNKEILQKYEQNRSAFSYKLRQLKWYTPGYLTLQPFVSDAAAAGNVSRNLKVRDFFKVHYGDSPHLEMKMTLLSDEIIQSLAAEASYSFSQTDSIATRQIQLMDLQQVFCDSADLNLTFTSVNTQHQPYQLISAKTDWNASAFRLFVQNKLIRAKIIYIKCELFFASTNTRVARQLRDGDVSYLMKMRSEQVNKDEVSAAMEMLADKISNISSIYQNQQQQLNNRIRRLESYFRFRKIEVNDFNKVTVNNRTFIVFQQRRSDSVNFTRTWRDYEIGFGDEQNFWLGLTNISALTIDNPRTLRVELEKFNGAKYALEYEGFQVFGPSTKYKMTYAKMKPHVTSRDAMHQHKDQAFSTWDSDNDKTSAYNCALTHQGGWWYNACYKVNPNGRYFNSESERPDSIQWFFVESGSSGGQSFKAIRMMLEVTE